MTRPMSDQPSRQVRRARERKAVPARYVASPYLHNRATRRRMQREAGGFANIYHRYNLGVLPSPEVTTARYQAAQAAAQTEQAA